jgi:hypothetical protein
VGDFLTGTFWATFPMASRALLLALVGVSLLALTQVLSACPPGLRRLCLPSRWTRGVRAPIILSVAPYPRTACAVATAVLQRASHPRG